MNLKKQFSEIRNLIDKAKENAFRSANTELINLYLSIGKYISKRINKSEWGKAVVDNRVY